MFRLLWAIFRHKLQDLLFLQFLSSYCIRDPFCIIQKGSLMQWLIGAETCSEVTVYVILKLSKYTVLLCRRKKNILWFTINRWINFYGIRNGILHQKVRGFNFVSYRQFHWIYRKQEWRAGMNRMNRAKWRVHEKTVMDFWVRKMRIISWLAVEPSASQEGVCFIQLIRKFEIQFLISVKLKWYLVDYGRYI